MPYNGIRTEDVTHAGTVTIPGSTTPHPEWEHPDRLLDVRHEHIAVRAYFKAERRGFSPGRELADWLAAEQEIDDEARSL